jgi:hypothetical protein
MSLAISRTSATRLQFIHSQIVSNISTTVMQGACDISGTKQAYIMAGPKHLWTEIGGNGQFFGCVMVDPSPEPAGLISLASFSFVASDTVGNGLNRSADFWSAADINLNINQQTRARAFGPFYVVNNSSNELITAAGSYVYFPVSGCSYPVAGTATDNRFCGTFAQFVWVERTIAAGSFVSVPIDVGVIGIFQVLTNLITPANNSNGARLAVRVG